MKAVVQPMPGITRAQGTADELADLADHVGRAESAEQNRDSSFVARDFAKPPGIAAAGARRKTPIDGILLSGATASSGAQLVCDQPELRTELRRGSRAREPTGRSRRAERIQGRSVGRTLHTWATHMQ
ncbi:hypothetical protein ACFUNF_06130 [Streptomyces sp. NPDC057291]|uniref:hypothetical protein n=1 Tax=Streptomyces sp. NPDC057291 TaxID=3346087 RepID=UPI00362B9F96